MSAFEIVSTQEFDVWIRRLPQPHRARVIARLRAMEKGNLGDRRAVGHGVSESRIDWGPGLRVYFVQRGQRLIVLLHGGDKSTQRRDIENAISLAGSL